MAAGKFVWATTALKYIANQRVDLEDGTIVAYLLKDTYTPGTASHSQLAQFIPSHQATASATVVNPITLGGLTLTGSGASTIKWDADNIDGFSSDGSTIGSAKYLGIVAQSASSGTGIDNLIVGFINLNADAASSSVGQSVQVNITWPAGGIGKLESNP